MALQTVELLARLMQAAQGKAQITSKLLSAHAWSSLRSDMQMGLPYDVMGDAAGKGQGPCTTT